MTPDSVDHRRLGVALSGWQLDGQALSMTDARLQEGWHDAEESWRWTDGDAVLDVDGARELRVEIAMQGRYWTEAATRG